MNCKCGHDWLNHRYTGTSTRRGGCSAIAREGKHWLDFDLCPCKALDISRLPEPGERLEFGRHWLNPSDAEAAPAWPSLDIVRGRADAKFTRQQKRYAARMRAA